MNLRNLSAWSIRNPIVPIVMFIGLLLAGIVAFNRMDVNASPDIDFPFVNVNISQPGAAPTEIETQITQKVEAAVRSINGVDEIQSSAREGGSWTGVQFVIGTDTNDAVNEVKNAVDQIRGDLPDGILEPRVSKEEIGGNGPIGLFAVRADDMTMEQLSWFVDDTVSRTLLSVEGMASVSRSGGVDREISVVLDPARMQSLGVTAAQLNSSLRQTNTDAAGGQAEIAGSRQSVRVLGNAENAYDLGQTNINLSGGRSIKLTDVANVYDGYSEQTSIAKIRGQQVVTFSIERAKGYSDVTVYDEAIEKIEEMDEQNDSVHFTQIYTSVDYTKEQYETSMAAMIEGAVLAIVVVFLFLRDWRATIISAIAIPLSAIPSFYFMSLLGFTLNELSLLALSLVAGVLVDDAIVEIENIVRHMRMGKSAYQASIDAADEIGLPVVATTFSIVAVFLPVGLMPGISGQFFKSFGLTVVITVLMSLLVARMITPMIAAYFLQAKGNASHGEGWLMDRYMRVLHWTLDTSNSRRLRDSLPKVPTRLANHIIALAIGGAVLALANYLPAMLGEASEAQAVSDESSGDLIGMIVDGALLALTAYIIGGLVKFILGALYGSLTGFDRNYFTRRTRYMAVRMHLLDHRLWMFGVGIGSLVLTVLLLIYMPGQFQPTTDSDTSRARIETVPGTTIEQTEQISSRVAALLEDEAAVDMVMESVGEGSASLFVMLSPERSEVSTEFERRMANDYFKDIPDARVTFQSQSGGGGTGRDISVMLTGSDPVLLKSTAQTLVEQMAGVEGVSAPRIAADIQRPELIIAPRLDLAAQLGVTTSALSQTIRIATIGEIDQNAAKFSLSDRQIPIRVMLPKDSRRDIATIENLPVPTASGGSVPLKRVADISFGAGPTQIQRYNQSRRIFVGSDLAEGMVKGPVMDAINALPIMENLPAGVSNAPVGDDRWQQELITSMLIAVISGILLVFGVLVLLYRRFVSPLVNMTSLLLAPLGGLIALLMIGQPITIAVYIGLLMLLGIVAKNSILLIDFALVEMDKGVSKFEAIVDAGHKRAQPIVMTTMAMSAGMIPTALSLSGDGAWRAPMGTTVIGGLILSTVLTLLIVPAGFSLADGFEKRIGPWLRKRFLTYAPGDDNDDRKQSGAYPAE